MSVVSMCSTVYCVIYSGVPQGGVGVFTSFTGPDPHQVPPAESPERAADVRWHICSFTSVSVVKIAGKVKLLVRPLYGLIRKSSFTV